MSAQRYLAGSLTRISDLDTAPFELEPVDRGRWRNADYVVAEVRDPGAARRIELPSGRLVSLEPGDVVIGALGERAATLEATGDWRAVGSDLRLDLLTSAGLFGRATSVSGMLGPLARLAYRAHVVRGGRILRMDHFVRAEPVSAYTTPTLLIIGTSMSAGKTTTARAVIRHLVRSGLAVAGAKLTGAGRYRDILTMRDAGADPIVDFVDAGLPSSIGPAEVVRPAIAWMLSRIQRCQRDLAVVEAGASPLEPYNGELAIDALGDSICFIALAASDPYAVLGVTEAFGVEPDMVTGIATNTSAGIALVERLTGLPAINVRDPRHADRLAELLEPLVGDARGRVAPEGGGAGPPVPSWRTPTSY